MSPDNCQQVVQRRRHRCKAVLVFSELSQTLCTARRVVSAHDYRQTTRKVGAATSDIVSANPQDGSTARHTIRRERTCKVCVCVTRKICAGNAQQGQELQ